MTQGELASSPHGLDAAVLPCVGLVERGCREGSGTRRRCPETGEAERPLRVLVVDDRRRDGLALVELVRGMGHAADLATDGLSALRLAATCHPDLVFLNVVMTRLEDGQTARRLRRDFPRRECLIVGFAKRVDSRLRRHCEQAGVDLLLVKPLDAEVVDTLCLLECTLVNQRRTGTASPRRDAHVRRKGA